jgi:hypothetical protein
MNARQAAQNLELIRTLMERTCQYQFLTARAGLAAGSMAGAGALTFLVLDAANPWHFGIVWGLVFIGSCLATVLGTVLRGSQRGERVWSRQARAVLLALAPSLFVALVMTVLFYAWDAHLWLPGVWMLCYGQGALATSTYAPAPIRSMGLTVLLLGSITLMVGPIVAIPMMGIVFGLGHVGLGTALLIAERRESGLRLHRSVA